MQEQIKQQFREDEVALIKHRDKKNNEWVTNVYPKIGGRLRLAHDENPELGIETDIYKYDEKIAVVISICRTSKGAFKGIGMASVNRDEKIAPAILELAETRALSRSLRFAGYGVEYCSAEEVSHLQSTSDNQQGLKKGNVKVGFSRVAGHNNVYKPEFEANENNQPGGTGYPSINIRPNSNDIGCGGPLVQALCGGCVFYWHACRRIKCAAMVRLSGKNGKRASPVHQKDFCLWH